LGFRISDDDLASLDSRDGSLDLGLPTAIMVRGVVELGQRMAAALAVMILLIYVALI
jgi:hypothetical protein